MKLTQAIQALCIATRADGRSVRTVEAYREKLSHLVAFLGDVPIEQITTADLRRFIVAQMDRGLSMFTVASRIRAIKRLFNWLFAEGEIHVNPVSRIKTPDPPRGEPKGITPQDMIALLKTTKGGSVEDVRDKAIILFLGDTACRVGGLCGLEVQNLDVGNGRAQVTEKRNKTRIVMFTEPTADALREWLAVRPGGWGNAVFVGLGYKSRGALTPSGVLQMLRRRAKRAGVTGAFNPHSFRHAFARFFLLDGGDLATLADLLGHEDVSITKKWYAVFTVGELQGQHKKHSPILRMFDLPDGKAGGSGDNGKP